MPVPKLLVVADLLRRQMCCPYFPGVVVPSPPPALSARIPIVPLAGGTPTPGDLDASQGPRPDPSGVAPRPGQGGGLSLLSGSSWEA